MHFETVYSLSFIKKDFDGWHTWLFGFLLLNTLFRPQASQSLTCGCTLLLLGSLADIFGSRRLYLIGCALQCLSSLACGLSRSGTQLIIFRAFTGLSSSCCLPSAVSIINHTFKPGRKRSFAFALMGGGQPLGFGSGLLLGGILAGTIGWRWGFYIVSILSFLVLVMTSWQLPRSLKPNNQVTWRNLSSQADWVGVVVASASLAMLSYVLAYISSHLGISPPYLTANRSLASSTSVIKRPQNIVLLVLSLLLMPAFVLWVQRQEKLGRPALIPNSLWRNRVFSSICINVFLIWGSFNAFEQITNLFFQRVQRLSAFQAGLRYSPGVVTGIVMSLVMGLIVHRIRGNVIIGVFSFLSLAAPIIMALINPEWIYWRAAFPAIILNTFSADATFTISNLLISASFPADTQALAGGVFNTISQLGNAVGMTLAILIAQTVTSEDTANGDAADADPAQLLKGDRATYWFFFGLLTSALCVSVVGLHRVGVVGSKNK